MFTIQLKRPIGSAKLLGGGVQESSATSGEAGQTELLELQKERLAQSCQGLQEAANRLNEFQENLFKGHKEQIAKLSVEIARKILVQEIKQGDYEIESIIQASLEKAPTRQDVVVHLNPEDLAQCQKVQEENSGGNLAGVKLAADVNIGRAECLLETPKGIVESFINQHLEQISEALKKAE